MLISLTINGTFALSFALYLLLTPRRSSDRL